jgi:hypothetical protein
MPTALAPIGAYIDWDSPKDTTFVRKINNIIILLIPWLSKEDFIIKTYTIVKCKYY